MSAAARVMLWGMLLVVAGVASYAAFDFEAVLGKYPHWMRPLRSVLRPTLHMAWYWALIVPALLLAGSVYRVAASKTGRAMVVWRLFAYLTLWGIGSFAFFFGLFLVYAPSAADGGTALLVPALIACFGYILLGVGFVFSVLGRG